MNIVQQMMLQKQLLTEHQKNAWKNLNWFMYGSRASGRSYLHAAIVLNHLVDNVGEKVMFWDHHAPTIKRVNRNMLMMIRNLYETLELESLGYLLEIGEQEGTVCIKEDK